jgi:ComF family protein
MNPFPGSLVDNPGYHTLHFFWKIVDMFYPPFCGGCGKPGARWCKECLESTIKLSELLVCGICSRPIQTPGICKNCTQSPPSFDNLKAWGVYSGPLRRAIHRFKYENDLALADTFALFLIQLYNNYRWPVDMIVPVPLSKKRFNERGYNQSAHLALPVSLALKKSVSYKAVMRIKDTHPQFDLSVSDRWQNVDGAFNSQPKIVAGKNILLIDDITTTGATINACAKSLKKAGADGVYALTVSYAL